MRHLKKCFIVLVLICLASLSTTPVITQESGVEPEIKYHDVNSEIAQQQTKLLREAQNGMVNADYGEEIVFVLDNGIYVQNADGTGRRWLIARGSGYAGFFYPAWSLDGTKIAFAAIQNDPRVVDLIVANADGSNPTVILTLDSGYFNSKISQISWHWGNEYIMFSYWYDDYSLNVLYVVCAIHWTGSPFTIGSGPDRSYCQYEPVQGSSRYAYIAQGRPFYFHSDLRVSNLDGSNDILWLQHTNVISGFTHVCWNSATSIYTIIRQWNQAPNQEVLLRVDRIGGQTYYTPLVYSDPGASLWSPTVSPSRSQLYNSEMTTQTSTLYLTTFKTDGSVLSIVPKGVGFFPNWRQIIPPPPPVISGYVRTSSGQAISGVEMAGLPGNPSTNSNGYYSATVAYGWSGTVTPTKTDYTFNPSNRVYSNITSNQSNQNYTGTPVTTEEGDDLIGSWGSGVWYRNSLTGSWVHMSTPAILVAAGDVNGDNTDDLIGTWSSGLWVKNSSTGTWVKLSSNLPTSIASGDMNGDGRDDVVGSWASGVWYRNSVGGSWVKMSTPANTVAAGDTDGDNTDDLIGTWSSGLWVKNSSTGAWIKLSSTLPTDIASGDMNGDGRDDVVGTWASGVWYRNSLTGAWVHLATSANLVATGDIDGDSTDDLIGVWSSGLWVKHASTGSWTKITANPPSDIDAGLFRTETWHAGEKGFAVPVGVYGEEPGSGYYLDLSHQGPWGKNFIFDEEQNLRPQETESSKMERILGPEDPGFSYIKQQNLVPQERSANKKNKNKN